MRVFCLCSIAVMAAAVGFAEESEHNDFPKLEAEVEASNTLDFSMVQMGKTLPKQWLRLDVRGYRTRDNAEEPASAQLFAGVGLVIPELNNRHISLMPGFSFVQTVRNRDHFQGGAFTFTVKAHLSRLTVRAFVAEYFSITGEEMQYFWLQPLTADWRLSRHWEAGGEVEAYREHGREFLVDEGPRLVYRDRYGLFALAFLARTRTFRFGREFEIGSHER